MTVLLGQRLRRDWVQLTLWIVGTAALALLTYLGISETYGTERDRQALLATAIANPVVLLFRGLPSGAGEGAFAAFLILPFLAMLAAFMSSFLAVRHTRMEEESGRAELVGATPAGRMRPLAATLVHGILANALLAVLVALAFLAVGLPAAGSWVTGAAAGAVGVVFLGVGLAAGQLLSTSRAANATGVWVLVLSFLVAGIGNALGTPSDDLQSVQSSWLTWLSPFGWAENSRPFADDAVWLVLLCVAVGLVLAAVALTLQSVRDLGGGLIAERPGRARARPALRTPEALVWRLTWPAIVGWGVGGLLTGVLATALAAVLQQSADDIPSIQELLAALTEGGSLAQGAIVVFFTMLGILAASCAVQIVCRARQEEAHGTAELVLTAPVGRIRWLAGYLWVAFVGILVVVAAAMVGAVLGIASQTDPDWSLVGDVVVTGAGQIAAASVFLVLVAVVFVLAPRLTIALGWTFVLVGTIVGLFGALFGFPDWLVHLSPVAVAPTVTSDGFDPRGLWWLILATGVGAAVSLGLMRRRELAPAG